MEYPNLRNESSQITGSHQRPMTAPPSNNQLMSIVSRSNSQKKGNDLYQCVKIALGELSNFVLEDKSEEQPLFEANSQSIGMLLLTSGFFLRLWSKPFMQKKGSLSLFRSS